MISRSGCVVWIDLTWCLAEEAPAILNEGSD
jgi:hypothetical protein